MGSMFRIAFLLALAVGSLLCAGCDRHESRKARMEFHQLSRAEEDRLNKQRELVLSAARVRYGTKGFTRSKTDLPVIQRLIDDRVFAKTQTFELQALGVVFGDVLASELGLHWELVTDEYGTDPVLRLGTHQVQISALTMISKRAEDGKEVDVAALLDGVRDTLKQMKKSGDCK